MVTLSVTYFQGGREEKCLGSKAFTNDALSYMEKGRLVGNVRIKMKKTILRKWNGHSMQDLLASK